eukprot:scaffold236232_cov24-Tisochrysis_lutea.AAC.1
MRQTTRSSSPWRDESNRSRGAAHHHGHAARRVARGSCVRGGLRAHNCSTIAHRGPFAVVATAHPSRSESGSGSGDGSGS